MQHRPHKISPDVDHHLSDQQKVSADTYTTALSGRRQENSAATKVINEFVTHALSLLVSHFPLSIFVAESVSGTHSVILTHTHAHTAGTVAGGCDLSALRAHVSVWTQRRDRPVELFKPQGERGTRHPALLMSAAWWTTEITGQIIFRPCVYLKETDCRRSGPPFISLWLISSCSPSACCLMVQWVLKRFIQSLICDVLHFKQMSDHQLVPVCSTVWFFTPNYTVCVSFQKKWPLTSSWQHMSAVGF